MSKFKVTNKNYACSVVEITNLRKHTNADRLQVTTIYGNNVICGLDTKLGDKVLYFPLECQLSQEFAANNDLIRRKDEAGNNAGGMFDLNRRVRTIKLRNEQSEGFICPATFLSNYDLKVGDEFNSIDDYNICEKYIVPLTKQQERQLTKKNRKSVVLMESRLVENQFRLHFDTSQLGRNSHKIKPETLISITDKLHGTSFCTSNSLVKRNLKFYERFLQKLGVKIDDKEYDLIYSSRRVVGNAKRPKFHWRNLFRRNPNKNNGFYKGNLYEDISFKFKDLLHAGETVYGEAVGFTKEGQAIQKGYDYGCKPNEFEIYIYRITKTGVDGKVHEYSFPHVIDRANQLGIKYVPEVYYGKAMNSPFGESYFKNLEDGDFGEYFAKNLKEYVDNLGLDTRCKSKSFQEGVVVRIENRLELESLKCKNFSFLNHETKMLDEGQEDMESNQEETEESDENGTN
jgi:hypothetical protein